MNFFYKIIQNMHFEWQFIGLDYLNDNINQ